MQPNDVINDIDTYIAQFAPDIQAKLTAIRKAIREVAPEATEKIGYGMPTFVLNGNLVHFAAMKNHLGFYPAASGVGAFSDRLTSYKCSKGAIQIPYTEDLPLELIREIVQFRVAENLAKVKKGKNKR